MGFETNNFSNNSKNEVNVYFRPKTNWVFPKSRLPFMGKNQTTYSEYGRQGYIRVIFHKVSGGFLVIHPKHGQHEWEANKLIGRMLAEQGDSVVLLPADDSIAGSPDALRNDEIWEFKTLANAHNFSRALQGAIRRGKKQSPRVLCFIAMSYAFEELKLGIFNAVKFDRDLDLGTVKK